MVVVGGRTNSVNEKLPLEVFDTETSEWHAFESIQKFRHGCWQQDRQLMIYGGFELSTPNIPTDSIFKVSLARLF
jgi:protein phosphatase